MTRSGHRRQACSTIREAGFTLIEMLVVLGIIAITLSIAVPSFSRVREHLAVRNTAYALAAHLRSARAMAQSTNIKRGMTIDLSQRRYWAEGIVSLNRCKWECKYWCQRANASVVRPAAFASMPMEAPAAARILLRDDRATAAVHVDWMNGDVRVDMRP